MHLDKSHLTVHTYPESHPHKGVLVHSSQTLKCPHVVKSLRLKHLTI